MPTTQQLRSRLVRKLKELFQLNQPDLDFGFYRIMHAKAGQVTRFLEKDLLAIVADSFGQIDDSRKAQLEAEYEKELETAREYGAADPESVPKVKEARARYETAQDTATAEGEIYDHLYRFFERYYDNGDFISRRYYTRETPGKAAPFAVPYNGEEVKLHWANADQYYIKTAEHFRNFTVDLRQAKEIQEYSRADKLGLEVGDKAPRLVHFRIVDATEGEHGNIRASEATKRYFVIHKDEPVALTGEGELVIQFEYRPDPEKSGQEKIWRAKRNAEAVDIVLAALDDLAGENEYKLLLTVPAPTEKDNERPLLAKYINQYTARNTMDYFIHKDLGAFLRRELDFYIKNEVMRLDDISTAEAPAVETYLSNLKVLRTVAHKLIDFLAQLEDFQKRLWLKKKFVVETNYCITLDRIPEEFYPEIAANDAQREEWINLFSIDEIRGDLTMIGYSKKLKPEFLKAHPTLVVDTQYYDDGFTARLLEAIGNMDEQADGILFHGENFQALSLMQAKHREQVKCIYIDPPYNAKTSEILYKNTYKHASWLSLLHDRSLLAGALRKEDGVFVCAIDENEQERLGLLFNSIFPTDERVCVSVVHNPRGIQGSGFSFTHEYAYFLHRRGLSLGLKTLQDAKSKPLMKTGSESERSSGKNCFYPIFIRDGRIVGFGNVPTDNWHPTTAAYQRENGITEIWPISSSDGLERKWRYSRQSIEGIAKQLEIRPGRDGTPVVYLTKGHESYRTVWNDAKFNAAEYGSTLLKNILGDGGKFSFPKSIWTVWHSLKVARLESEDLALDFFAGSGTTGHAVINLNREDDGRRKFILVEMGNYFDSVLLPRIKKVTFTPEWKNGKPKRLATLREADRSPRIVKIIRLESYEDCLNNLVSSNNKVLDKAREGALAKNASLREDYMLHYMLDVETRGSQSLLNINAFADPTAYTLRIKKSGSDQYVTRNVDLIETFNYLIGLRVTHIAAAQTFSATFKRETDPELPENTQTRLVVDGRLTQDENGPWWFRKVEGWVPADPNNPNNGERRNILIVWRKLTGKIEEDNLMLDEWFQRNRISTRDFEFDVIYVNGSNNLPNLQQEDDNWKVRLIEEDFMRLMWDVEDV